MTFEEFYVQYLELHANPWCRRLHVLGLLAEVMLLGIVGVTQVWWLLALFPVPIYGLAWLGHFLFAQNHAATFRHPLWSVIGYWRMMAEMAAGKVPW